MTPSRPDRVLVITGAGVSAESGLPTYRGAGGLWRQRSPYELATLDAFEREPETVWAWYRERRAALASARPNPAHLALARLVRELPGSLLVTQNVDDLHERAGSALDALVHVHGELLVDRCTRCAHRARDLTPPSEIDPSATPPRCPRCEALLRPAVVWFGERLDTETIEQVEMWLREGPPDATIVVGTTATFSYIVDWATRGRRRGDGLIYEVNPDETPLSIAAHERLTRPAAESVPLLVERLLARS